MTIVFSCISEKLIAMTVDSAVVRDFDSGNREYTTETKAFLFDGVGCVATWGARDANRIGDYLREQNISRISHSVIDLANLVEKYLKGIYNPEQMGLDDVGYHVAGFDRNGYPRMNHIFWGFDRPRRAEQSKREYKNNDHSPSSGAIQFVYNGRNDLAQTVVETLLEQTRKGNVVSFHFSQPCDLACFGDFVARFAAEITPEVGPPFVTCLFSPTNKATIVRNNKLCPIDQKEVFKKLLDLGYH